MKHLLKIMELLRDKNHGCPWDLEQTLQSITQHTLEETYEVIEAIENEDYSHLANELGDLLFQIVFYAQIGKESGLFSFDNVVAEISEKLLRRHPHVFPEGTIESFGQSSGLNAKEVAIVWEQIKIKERSGLKSNIVSSSVLNDVPFALPAIMRAKKLQQRAATLKFDWLELSDVLGKVKEELVELEEAIEEQQAEHIQEEFGDLLFTMVNLGRHLNIDAEESLRKANFKFESRFRKMEILVLEDGFDFQQLSLDEMESYWNKVKLSED